MTRSSLELGWTDLAKRGVTTPLVIEHLDVVEQGLLRVGIAFETFALLTLDGREPALDDRVVVAIAPSAHRAHDPMLLEARPIVLAGIGAALVGVRQEPGVWTASLQGHVQGAQREMAIVDRAEGPAHDEPREQVENRGQI